MSDSRFRNNKLTRALSIPALMLLAAACSSSSDDDVQQPDADSPVAFSVTVENVSPHYDYLESGAQAIPAGASEAGPIFPGDAYEVSFHAGPGHRLSFALMFVHSNDLFYAPNAEGIALFDEDGAPVEGNITDQVHLWDAGTEVNQEPGLGMDQAPRQSGADTGAADPDNTVRLATDDFSNLPANSDVLQATLTAGEGNMFTLRISNVSTDQTLALSDNSTTAVPLAPVVYAIHGEGASLFTPGEPNGGQGLEALAEDGNPEPIIGSLGARTGLTSPLAPGAYAVHREGAALFTEGDTVAGRGLELLAEDGDPSMVAYELEDNELVMSSGTYAIPVGADEPGPLFPGQSYSFTIEARPGERLSFANMLVQSNDLFLAPDELGIVLFDDMGEPRSGDMTMSIHLWDAGTEVDQAPGAGPDQAPRQSGPNTGAPENGKVEIVSDDSWPAASEVVRVVITPM